MPLDPIISLSVALAEAPGACACLLGAGVSVDAGVPKASAIFRDGLQRLYRLEHETEESPNDEALDAWLRERGYETLGYSSLLDLVAPDPAVRRELLAGYFSGVEPGPTHNRLAEMAAAGVFRVFVTTNFDRLLERAMIARGLEPVVVSDEATLLAAPRREHCKAFIVKAHGDYLQETIRNTPSELAQLEPALSEELRAIVSHYGLLVLGWSGSDHALAEVVRGRSSRYGVWWLSRAEPPTEPASTLIDTVGARVVVRPSAGEFLIELDRRLAVYRTYESGDDPGSVHDEMLALLTRGGEVELDEMLRRERYAFESAIEAVRSEFAAGTRESAMLREGWERLSAAIDRRLGSLMPLAIYRPDLFGEQLRGHVAWASGLAPLGGAVAWVQAWQFPFWIIGMTVGGLAIRLDRYTAIGPILAATWTGLANRTNPFVGVPGELGAAVAKNFGPKPQGGNRWIFPEWQWLLADLESKDWLVARHPEWLRREGEPQRALIEFSVLLNIAAGLRDEHYLTAWWTLDTSVAERFVRHLRRDASMRMRAAEAVGSTLAVFDERGPDILESTRGVDWGRDTEVVAQILRGT